LQNRRCLFFSDEIKEKLKINRSPDTGKNGA
jgi:hypothetical protein